MKVLVTGTEGYIGTRLVPALLASGHDVVGLDTGFYRDGWMFSEPRLYGRSPTTLNKDLRQVQESDLHGFDAVVHLAELSNDPLGQNDPEVTFDINSRGSVRLARLARSAGVRRFVYASSCSVYGFATQDWVDERSPVNPQTAYARCKVEVETALGPMASDDFCVSFLRNATAYGASPRMRFDIVLNDLCALAWTRREIALTSDGTPWRPIVHIEDICAAIVCTLSAPASRVNGEVFNVGSDAENYRIREIAEIVAAVFPGCSLTIGSSSGDNRSYRVSFRKIHEQLPGFACRWDARSGAQQLHTVFERIQMPREVYEFRAYTRLKQLQYLKSTRQIDDGLYWQV